MALPVIAIVGRPNVGKSTLFNKLAGRRLSIVEPTPGVTRDRLYARCEWSGREYTIVDTGGIEPRTDDELLRFMREQAELAIENADVIVFVTDVRTGLTAADADIAVMLRRSGKPVLLAVNKNDRVGTPDPGIYEFYNLGLGEPYPVSGLHGHGSGDLLDACAALLPEKTEDEDNPESLGVAIIGKPNVGKSSLCNRILGEERVVVSNIPGTTRDAVDTPFENEYGSFVIIDTAGMRKKSRVSDSIEHYSVLRAVMAIERAEVCLVLIDAAEGVTEQDTKVAGLAHDSGKPSIIVVNKWDSIEKDEKTADRMRDSIRASLPFMSYAPIVFISALTGQRVNTIFAEIMELWRQSNLKITTGQLNEVLAEATSRVQPPSDKGKRLKLFYITQTGTRPLRFVVFVNSAKLFHFSYRRYIVNQLREVFGIDRVPLKLSARSRDEEYPDDNG